MTRKSAKKEVTRLRPMYHDEINELLDEVYDDFQSQEKEFTSRLDNAKKRYESKCQELDDCSAFSTKQALEINDFQSRTCENCKHYIKEQKLYDIVVYICRHEEVGDCVYDEMGKDFGCLKFERKDK